MSLAAGLRAVLFDLDGTLLDTAPDMCGAINRLRAQEGLEPLDYQSLRFHVSHGAARLVAVGFGCDAGARFESLRRRFLDLYRERLCESTRLFDGLDEVLRTLEVLGMPWGVVTNKPGWLTNPLLDRLGLGSRAACVISGDTLPERKPHPRPLLHAAGLIGIPPAGCVYIGDAERDIQAGRAAGMRTVVAGFGYIASDEDPLAWNADLVIAKPRDLVTSLGLRPHVAP